MTSFIEPGVLKDHELSLVLDKYLEADPEREFVPTYHFHMIREGCDVPVGRINLRIGNSNRLVLYRGQIGYGVEPDHRGNHFTARSIRSLIPLANKCGLNPLWITCDPDNFASRRSCEIAGGELVEIIDVSPEEEMYQRGIRQKCRFKFMTDARL